MFKKLQTAKDTLTDSSSRRSYDCWLNSRIHIPFEQWKAKKGHSMHWVNPKSNKLSIKEGSSTGQGSDFKLNNGSIVDQDSNWLKKFRNYEI